MDLSVGETIFQEGGEREIESSRGMAGEPERPYYTVSSPRGGDLDLPLASE